MQSKEKLFKDIERSLKKAGIRGLEDGVGEAMRLVLIEIQAFIEDEVERRHIEASHTEPNTVAGKGKGKKARHRRKKGRNR